MANIAAVRLSVKNRLKIKSADTSYDTVLDDFITSAVNRLCPRIGLESDVQTKAVTVDSYGEVSVDLTSFSTAIDFAREVEAFDGFAWFTVEDTFHHGKYLRLRGLTGDISTIRVYGITYYTAIDQVQAWALQAVYWYAMAEFYDNMTGDKKIYNIYAQQLAARGMESMNEMSDFFNQRADAYIEEQRQVYA